MAERILDLGSKCELISLNSAEGGRYLVDGGRHVVDGGRYVVDGGRHLVHALMACMHAGRLHAGHHLQ